MTMDSERVDFAPGEAVRADSGLFGPVAGTVLGPVAGDPTRLWVRWERDIATWGGPVVSETTVRTDWLRKETDHGE